MNIYVHDILVHSCLANSVHSRTHGNFNSKEVGMELAQSLLTLFDPTLDGMLLDTDTSQEQLLIPIYSKPKTVSTVLPGETFEQQTNKKQTNKQTNKQQH